MIAESGLDHLPGYEGEYRFSTFNAKAKTVSTCIDTVVLCWEYEQDPENAELLPDVELLEQQIAEAAKAMENAESPADKRKAAELKEDLMRLKRVEQIYVRL